MHGRFDLVGSVRKRSDQVDEFAVFANDEDILNADADLLFWDVDPRLDGKDHAWLQHCRIDCRIVYVDSDHVAEAVNPVVAERFAMQALAMVVNVVPRCGV